MIQRTGNMVNIKIAEDDLIHSLGLLQELRDFCKEHAEEDGSSDTVKALTTALETMASFWFEHFAEDDA